MVWKNKGHEYDDVGRIFQSTDTICLYGLTGYFNEIYYILSHEKIELQESLCLIDKKIRWQESGYQGNSVIAPEEFAHKEKDNLIVVICPMGKAATEIRGILLNSGVSEKCIFDGWDFLYEYISVYFLYKYNKVFFTSENVVPSSACNLNCRDCLNFNPYIKKPVLFSLEDEKENLKLFFDAVDKIYRFQVTGGEPLLYSNLKELFSYIDDNFRTQILRLEMVTNGTVVPSDELCEFLREKNVYVFLDDYTMSLADEKKKLHQIVENKFKEHNVWYVNNYVEKWFRLYPSEVDRSNFSDEQLRNFFDSCGNPWSTIEEGCISACNYALYAYKAGIIDRYEDEYYDLRSFTEQKKNELVEFRLRYNGKGYTKLCRKCGGFSSINTQWCEPAIQA